MSKLLGTISPNSPSPFTTRVNFLVTAKEAGAKEARATRRAPQEISARPRDQPIWSSWRAESNAEGGHRDSLSAVPLCENLAHMRSANREMVWPTTRLTFAKVPAREFRLFFK